VHQQPLDPYQEVAEHAGFGPIPAAQMPFSPDAEPVPSGRGAVRARP
jgi:hypothetical protein